MRRSQSGALDRRPAQSTTRSASSRSPSPSRAPRDSHRPAADQPVLSVQSSARPGPPPAAPCAAQPQAQPAPDAAAPPPQRPPGHQRPVTLIARAEVEPGPADPARLQCVQDIRASCGPSCLQRESRHARPTAAKAGKHTKGGRYSTAAKGSNFSRCCMSDQESLDDDRKVMHASETLLDFLNYAGPGQGRGQAAPGRWAGARGTGPSQC